MILTISLQQNIYKFFDTLVIIKSNSERFLSLFKSVYRRFLQQSRTGLDVDRKCEYVVLVEEEKNICQAHIDDQIYTTDCLDSSFRFLFMLIITSINNEIKSHFLFHAAAVAKDNKGIVFPAPPGVGKTTITMTLLEKGFKILTDDITAFNRKNSYLESYVRSFSVRENTINMLGIDISKFNIKSPIEDFGGDKKIIIDPEDYKKDCIVTKIPMKYIIFLEERTSKRDKDVETGERNLFITFSETSKEFIDDIKKIHGIKDVMVDSKEAFPRVKIVIRQHAKVITKLEALCSKYKYVIMNAQNSERIHDYENKNPELTEIQKSEAVIQLLKNFWNCSTRSALLRQEYKGNISLLYLDLIEVIRNVKCYQMSVGKLDKMVGKITELIKQN